MTDDKTPRKTSDMARKIWLAGIGAYGKAFEEGRDMVKGMRGNLGGTTSDVFETLAEKGEQLETAAKVRGAQLAGKASDLREDLGIEDRIQAMRDRLGSGSTEDRIDALEARLVGIETKLDALIKASAKPKPKRATTTRTTTAKKPVAKKPAAKKPAAKKPAARKTAAKKTAAKKTTTRKTTAKKT